MSNCQYCQQPLQDNQCVNPKCQASTLAAPEALYAGSLIPEGYDGSQLIDHTFTINPETDLDDQGNFVGHDKETSVPVADQTRLVDDEFFREIAGFLERHQLSASEPKQAPRDRHVTHTLQAANAEEQPVPQQFVIPVREVHLPSDSTSIEKNREGGEFDENDYLILSKLGEGAGGIVYQAEQRALQRSVAVKVLKERRFGRGKDSDANSEDIEKRRNKFYHEAMLTARLEHPNIVPIHDMGINPVGAQFYSMKLIDQNSWADSIRTSDIDRNIEIFMDVCNAMRYAHDVNVIHRDLKPENVMVGRFGEVYVVDWGMAVDKGKTPVGFSAGGTPCYMPPEMANHFLKQVQINAVQAEIEQAKAEGTSGERARELQRRLTQLKKEEEALARSVGVQSDLYLLGAILFEIAVGHPPHLVPRQACQSLNEKHKREFWLSSQGKIQHLIKVTDPLRLSLHSIALRALAPRPQDRFQSVEEFQNAIRGYQDQLQSIKLTDRGFGDLEKARQGEGYQHLLPSLESFREANRLWSKNERAHELQVDAACLYAERANSKRDFDAGLSILDDYTQENGNRLEPRVVQLREKLVLGQRRRTRQRAVLVASWLAAVLLPLGVIGVSYYLTKETFQNYELAKEELGNLEGQLVDLDAKTRTAVAEAQAASAMAAEAGQIAEEKTREAMEATKLAAEKARLAEEKQKAADDAEALAAAAEKQQKQAEILAEANAKAAESARMLAEEAEQKRIEADELAQMAQAKKIEAEKEAERLRFDSEISRVVSIQSSLPSLINTNRLGLARDSLNSLLDNDSIADALKQGWDARYLARRSRPGGFEQSLASMIGEAGSLSISSTAELNPGRFLITASDPAGGELRLVEVTTGERDGDVQARRLPVDLPPRGNVVHSWGIEVGADSFLVLALDNVREADGANPNADAAGEPFWIINLATGKRAFVPQQNDPSALGCRYARWFDLGNGQLELITVEEEAFDYQTTSRIHWMSRRFRVNTSNTGSFLELIESSPETLQVGQSEGQLIEPESQFVTYKFTGDTWDDSRVDYLAASNRVDGQIRIAVASTTIVRNADGNAVSQVMLQLARTGSQGVESLGNTFLAELPTSILVDNEGNVWAGFANGTIKGFAGQRELGDLQTLSEHANDVLALALDAEGNLVSGSKDGIVIAWQRDPVRAQWQLQKRLLGHPGQISSIASGEDFLLTTDEAGTVRRWNPNSTIHDPYLQVDFAGITCGAIDQSAKTSGNQAVAFGTKLGTVHYFGPTALDSPNPDAQVIPNPFATFDSNFNDYSGLGKVGDFLVLFDREGHLNVWNLMTRDRRPLRIAPGTFEQRELVRSGFRPVLQVAPDESYLVTNDPVNERNLLFWIPDARYPSGFRLVRERLNLAVLGADSPVAVANADSRFSIRAIELAPQGDWLALITKRADRSSQVAAFALNRDALNSGGTILSANAVQSGLAGRFRVDDPAFVAFTPDARRLIFHFFQEGSRKTLIGSFVKSGDQFVPDTALATLVLDDQDEQTVVDWTTDPDRGALFLGKKNRDYTLLQRNPAGEVAIRSQVDGLRGALFSDSGRELVLLRETGQLEFVNSQDLAAVGKPTLQFDSPLGLKRLNETTLAVLDRAGFHLVRLGDEPTRWSTGPMIESSVACTDVALCGQSVAVTYDNGVTAVFDVSRPTEPLGVLQGAGNVQLSPDAKWLSVMDRERQSVVIHAVDSGLPTTDLRFSSGKDWIATAWRTTPAGESELLLVDGSLSGQLQWFALNPVEKSQVEQPLFPTQLSDSAMTGGLQIDSIAIAPLTQRYLAVVYRDATPDEARGPAAAASRIKVWADGWDPRDHGGWMDTESQVLSDVRSATFSEMAGVPGDVDSVATRLVLATRGQGEWDPRIYLLATKYADENTPVNVFKFEEIQSVLGDQSSDKILRLQFSGNGRSLLNLRTNGFTSLLSNEEP